MSDICHQIYANISVSRFSENRSIYHRYKKQPTYVLSLFVNTKISQTKRNKRMRKKTEESNEAFCMPCVLL